MVPFWTFKVLKGATLWHEGVQNGDFRRLLVMQRLRTQNGPLLAPNIVCSLCIAEKHSKSAKWTPSSHKMAPFLTLGAQKWPILCIEGVQNGHFYAYSALQRLRRLFGAFLAPRSYFWRQKGLYLSNFAKANDREFPFSNIAPLEAINDDDESSAAFRCN